MCVCARVCVCICARVCVWTVCVCLCNNVVSTVPGSRDMFSIISYLYMYNQVYGAIHVHVHVQSTLGPYRIPCDVSATQLNWPSEPASGLNTDMPLSISVYSVCTFWPPGGPVLPTNVKLALM